MEPTLRKAIYWPVWPRPWLAGRLYARGPVADGVRHGDWEFWYRSGARQMAGPYARGRKHGEWTKWWENGRTQSRGSFVEGRMHGPWSDWYEDGSLAQESFWEHGRKAGQWAVYERGAARVKDRPRFDPQREPVTEFTLLTDRDVTQMVTEAQKARLARSWGLLVGARVARRVPAWAAGVWILLFVPAVSISGPVLGFLAAPVSATAAGICSVAVARLARLHEEATRPDAATAPGHR